MRAGHRQRDALVLKALALVLGQHLPVSSRCTHLKGNGGAKHAVREVRDHLPGSGTVDADRWPDETAVRELCPKAVCTKCGVIGADVRPNWSERPQPESLVGAQWR
jgi:hypothetical protein